MRNLLAFLRRIPNAIVHGDGDVMMIDVTADSRTVRPGFAFVAIRGSAHDGHTKIDEAIQAGAVAVIGEIPQPESMLESSPHVTYVQVPDSRLAYARMVHALHDNPIRGLRLFGVTGTNGKTTVATILRGLETALGRETGFIGTTGIDYDGVHLDATHTTPDVRRLIELLLDMKARRVDTVCMEVSSHALHQHRVEGLEFSGAIFTNLTRDHLDYHGTMDDYARSKKMLFDGLSPESIAVLNGDDGWADFIKSDCKARKVLTVGIDDENSVVIEDVVLSAHGSEFTLCFPAVKRGDAPRDLHIRTPLLGSFNVMNVALCVTMAVAHGASYDVVQRAIASVQGPPGRMERYPLMNGATAVVDYAHTPDALRVALATLRELLPANGKLSVVFGCGGDRDAGKRGEMGAIAAEGADTIIVTNDNPRTESPENIADAIVKGVKGAKQSRCTQMSVELDRRQAIRTALDSVQRGDIILVAGKGHETYQIIGTERLSFRDVEEIARWNAERRTNGANGINEKPATM